ncbi:uncharacterized protein [Arachis hypogaea]|uniref:uncharacterized protein n=1 Tax=Arachis hypogaea TaxID=3818 RepID=UPI003B21AE1E
MDAYSGYNQILMHHSNQSKTAFITDFGNYCYKVMPFGLKNAGATYQLLMDKVFAKQIGRNIEVYVDDMIAKTQIGKNHIDDLAEIFDEICRYNMRLNPEKCAFVVQGGRLIKWAIELSEFDIRYQSRGPIKSQFLADFIVKLTIPSEEDHTKQWTLYMDGSSNNGGCGAGIHLEVEDGFILEHSLHLAFKVSNNQSEYEALLAGLRLCLDLHISAIKLHHSDISWPFNQWRLDILGPFPTTPGQNLKIRQHFASVEHPQTNGLAEATNKVNLHALKKKLDDAKGLWAKLIPEISIRTHLDNQDEARRSELDIIEEIRDIATLRQRAAQHALDCQYNKMVKSRSFGKGDLILRKTDTARKPPSHGKLAANWDGPYRIAEVLGNGVYKLESIDGKILPNTWNVSSRKKFYS